MQNSDTIYKKRLLSLHIDLSMFEPATEEEKVLI